MDGALASGSLATTSVTEFGLRSGARTPAASEKIDTVLAALPVLPLDERVDDYLIAGICLTRSRALLTRNRSHFERVPGLQLAE